MIVIVSISKHNQKLFSMDMTMLVTEKQMCCGKILSVYICPRIGAHIIQSSENTSREGCMIWEWGPNAEGKGESLAL